MLGGYTDPFFIFLYCCFSKMIFLSKNVECTCQTSGSLNMGSLKSDNLPHCLRQKFLSLYTIHGVMLHC